MKALLIATALFAGSAHAEFWDGNKLFDKLTHTDTVERIHAMGYVIGVADALNGVTYCPTGNPTAGQVRDMVLQFLRSSPGDRHNTADTIVNHVLKNNWPCARRGDGVSL